MSTDREPPPRTPLEAEDPERARVLKQKILHRLADMQRHYDALRAAMEEFGGFDREAFAEASASSVPEELNRVKAVERGVDLIYNYVAELAAFGLELAALRRRDDDTNARRDFERLLEAGVMPRTLVARLQDVRELRRSFVHEYPTATAANVHEAAELIARHLPDYLNRYRAWITRGFGTAASSSRLTPSRKPSIT